MCFLSRLLGHAMRKRQPGAHLDAPEPWIVPPTRDAAAMLRALPSLFPGGGFVYFEGTTEAAFESWLQAHAASEPLRVAYGTIWPKPDYYHVPLDRELMHEAAALIENAHVTVPSIHIHAHDGTKVLLEWHDAFSDDPMYISSEISRDQVESFAAGIKVGPVEKGGRAT